MSTYEYNDMFLKCQDTGKYHVFTFDIEGSKKMDNKTRYDAQVKLIKLMKCIYSILEEIQEKTGKNILVLEEGFVSFDSGLPYKGFGMKQEPFLFGDTIGFTMYRDSLDKDIVLGIYEYFRKALDIDFNMHMADGYYETNDYSEGATKYFRGYCIDLLSNIHKKETKEDLKRLRKKLSK